MRLLIVTPKVDLNDPLAGFFHRWIEEFALHFERVTVLCLTEGKHSLPPNVSVRPFGKGPRTARKMRLVSFFGAIWGERGAYDAVFVHMDPSYVVLGGLLWKFFGKKIGFWYTNEEVDVRLRLAEKLSDVIFTASAKSFRIESKKVYVTGHGIDTDFWKPLPDREENQAFTVLSVGRMSPVKKHESVVMAEVLKRHGKTVKLIFVGHPARRRDDVYYQALQKYVEEKGMADAVVFLPLISNEEMRSFFQHADLLVNTSASGSLDKVVLEAMATGLPPITGNEAFSEMLSPFGLALRRGGTETMAEIAERIMETKNKETLRRALRGIVERDHDIKSLIEKISLAYADTRLFSS